MDRISPMRDLKASHCQVSNNNNDNVFLLKISEEMLTQVQQK